MQLSDKTENIFKALALFRKEIIQPRKDASNPQFRSKYVALENVTDAIDKVAHKHGLAYTQNVTTKDEHLIGVQTMITHESGEYIIFDWLYLDSRPVVKGGGKGSSTSQSQGSAITYGRRYTLSSAFGIASDVDDDGNGASRDDNQQRPNNNQQPNYDNQNNNQSNGQPTQGEYLSLVLELNGQIIKEANKADIKLNRDNINQLLIKKFKLENIEQLNNVDRSPMIAALKEMVIFYKKKQMENKQKQESQNLDWEGAVNG